MSTIKSSTTSTTAYSVVADTTGTLVLQTGATPTTAVTIDGSQNVGIGTSSPSSKLTVDGGNAAIRTGNKFYLWNTANDNAPYLKHVNGGIGFFNTSDVQAMQTDSSGNLLVGITSNPDTNRINVKQSGAFATIGVYAGTNNGLLNWYKNDNTYLASVTFSGATITYGTGSDYRLKENVTPIGNALEKVAALKPVSFTWKDDGSYGESFIAHELQELYPTAVNGTKDAIDSEGNPRYQGVDPSKLIAVLTAAIQELKAELDAAKADIATLKGQA